MKHTAAVLALALLTAGLTAPAAAAVDPAPTNVKISWKDDKFEFVHVTWDEDGARPDRIVVRKVGDPAERASWHIPADAPNSFDVPKAAVRQGSKITETLEIGVATGTEAGETSAVAVSAAFDVHFNAPPDLISARPSGTNSVTVKWSNWPNKDSTPDDPLDRDDTVYTNPMYQIGTAAPVQIGKPVSAEEFTFTGPKPPYDFYVWSENEWARGGDSERVHVRATAFTASIPTWVVANNNTVISGTYPGPSAAKVTLQARNSASTAWYVVGTTDFTSNKYRFSIPSMVSRQYRVAFPNRSEGLNAWYGGYSGATTTTVQQWVTTTGSQTVHRYASPQQMSVYITPAIAGPVVLQRWTGKAWVFVDYMDVRYGWANRWISTAVLGRFTYRVYAPNQRFRGLPVAAAYSPNFVITIQP